MGAEVGHEHGGLGMVGRLLAVEGRAEPRACNLHHVESRVFKGDAYDLEGRDISELLDLECIEVVIRGKQRFFSRMSVDDIFIPAAIKMTRSLAGQFETPQPSQGLL